MMVFSTCSLLCFPSFFPLGGGTAASLRANPPTHEHISLNPPTHEHIFLNPPTQGPFAANPPTHGPIAANPPTHGPFAANPPTHGPITANPSTHGPIAANPSTHGPIAANPSTHGSITANPPTHGPFAANPSALLVHDDQTFSHRHHISYHIILTVSLSPPVLDVTRQSKTLCNQSLGTGTLIHIIGVTLIMLLYQYESVR